MGHFSKQLLLSIIVIQLFALPILVIGAKKQQETRSRAAPISEMPAEEIFEVGNSDLSAGKDFSGESAPESQSLKVATVKTTSTPINPALKKDVYAYLPYWEIDGETDTYLQYKYMTHLIYHGISLGKNGVINKTNGPWNTWKGERMGKIVQNARADGVKVLPNIVLFNSSSNPNLNDFLDNTTARNKSVAQIMDFLKTSPQPVDGVAIDFEYPGSAQKEELVDFTKKLRTEMKNYNSEWTLTIAVSGYSYGGGGFDLAKLSPEVDSFFVMSYHLKNASTAKNAGSTNPISALNSLTDNYIKKIPANKIVLGFPLYLAEWKTVDDSLRSEKVPGTGSGISVEADCGLTGTTCTRLAQRHMQTYGRKYDKKDKAAYYSFYVCTGSKKGWRQVYFDDEQAFTEKFAIVNNKDLKGVGFWAQNYDKGYLDTWSAIYNAFGDKNALSAPTKKAGFITPPAITNNGCVPPSSATNTPTPIPTNIPAANSPNPTSSPGETVIRFTSIKLHGIGNGGDNTNPNIAGNLNPLNKTRKLTVEIYDISGNMILKSEGNVIYNSVTGDFQGDLKLSSNISSGKYLIKIKSPTYLRAQLAGIISINKSSINQMTSASLIAGDSNLDGVLSVLDYEMIRDCYSDLKPARNCDSIKKSNADISDDGNVNQDDYSLFLRELSVASGD